MPERSADRGSGARKSALTRLVSRHSNPERKIPSPASNEPISQRAPVTRGISRWSSAITTLFESTQPPNGSAQYADAIGRDIDLDVSAYDRLLRESYVLATQALADPSRWPEAEAAMRRTEQQTGLMNFLGVLQPGRDVRELIDGLDRVRERSYSSWDLLPWTSDLAHLRRDPAFGDYLRRNGILDYWKRHGFPEQCRPVGDSAACD